MTVDGIPSDRAELRAVLLLIGQEIDAWDTGARTGLEAETRIRDLVRSARNLVEPSAGRLDPPAPGHA